MAQCGHSAPVCPGVEPNSIAADHGIRRGDVILDVGGKAMSDAGDIHKALVTAKAQGKKDALMRIRSADAARFIAVPLKNNG